MAPLLRKPHKSEGMAALMAHLFVLSQSQCGADGIVGIFRSTSHESAVATEIAALPPWLGDVDLVILRVSPGQGEDDPFFQWVASSSLKRLLLIASNPTLAVRLRQTMAGPVSFLAAPYLAEELVARVEEIVGMEGDSGWTAPSANGSTHQMLPGEHLTEREHDVFALLATGSSNKEIARRLCIKEHTVEFHVRNILQKLGAASRTEATAMLFQQH